MIVFSRRLAEELGEHALKEHPNETCGILAGHIVDSAQDSRSSARKDGEYASFLTESCQRKNGKKIVEKVYRCRNISRHPEARYAIDSGEMLQAFKDAEERGLEILGFYHSHPFAMDHPSNIDEEMAAWHEYSYVIVSDMAGIAIASPQVSRTTFLQTSGACSTKFAKQTSTPEGSKEVSELLPLREQLFLKEYGRKGIRYASARPKALRSWLWDGKKFVEEEVCYD